MKAMADLEAARVCEQQLKEEELTQAQAKLNQQDRSLVALSLLRLEAHSLAQSRRLRLRHSLELREQRERCNLRLGLRLARCLEASARTRNNSNSNLNSSKACRTLLVHHLVVRYSGLRTLLPTPLSLQLEEGCLVLKAHQTQQGLNLQQGTSLGLDNRRRNSLNSLNNRQQIYSASLRKTNSSNLNSNSRLLCLAGSDNQR